MTLQTIPKPENMAPVEFRIVRRILALALGKGYTVSVNDDTYAGGDWVVKRSRDLAEIMASLASTGGDFLKFRDTDGNPIGAICLVYNGDDSVVADCSEGPEVAYLLDEHFA